MAESYTYQKKRKEFGRHTQFEDTDTKIVGSIPPDPNQSDFFMMRDPNKLVLSNLPVLSQHSVSFKNLNLFILNAFKYYRLTLRESQFLQKVCLTKKEVGPQTLIPPKLSMCRGMRRICTEILHLVSLRPPRIWSSQPQAVSAKTMKLISLKNTSKANRLSISLRTLPQRP